MASPDFRPYFDLTLMDKSRQDIYDAAATLLATNLAAWVPREGNTEVLLMEAMAAQVEESVFAINRVPNAIMETLLVLFGIERDVGTLPVATLKFNMAGTSGYTIPSGTQARLSLPGGLEDVVFTTNVDLVIAPGNLFGTVSATGHRYTMDANSVSVGTYLDLLDSLIYVESVQLDAITTNGANPESDTDYFARAVARFGRLTDTLVLPVHFTNATLEDPTFVRAFAIDNWAGGGGTPGTEGGHITVAVYGNGANNTGGEKTALEARLEAAAAANLDIHVIDPTITSVAVTATVKAKAGYDTAAVQTAVQDALTAYLDPMKWDWGTTVRRFELVSLMDQVVGVEHVVSITVPASDVTLTGNAPLADAGALTITVN